MVIATQNPIEHHGTYPLPESQLDRFLMRLRIGYPDERSEREILAQRDSYATDTLAPVLSAEEILQLQERIHEVRVDEALTDYIMAVVERTRAHESLSLGVSPRGAQALYRASQALAIVEGRDYVIPDDIKRLVAPIFAHRVVINTRVALTQRGSEAGDRILEEILTLIDAPL
jgi:MoxR-like ATPase